MISILRQELLLKKTFVFPMGCMGCWRYFDPGILGSVAALQQTFLLPLAHIQANTREVTKKSRALDLIPQALEISMIGKTTCNICF